MAVVNRIANSGNKPATVRSRHDSIFISYRRGDSQWFVRQLHEKLAQRYGSDAIFMDVDSIAAGSDFTASIDRAIESCRVVFIVIGPQWSGAKNTYGLRRLDNPMDFVLLEISAALRSQKRLIPVLIDGAPMPTERELPSAISTLAKCQAFEISTRHFHADFERLLAEVSGDAKPRLTKRLGRWARPAFFIVAVGLFVSIGVAASNAWREVSDQANVPAGPPFYLTEEEYDVVLASAPTLPIDAKWGRVLAQPSFAEFDETPFQSAIAFLATQHDFNASIDELGLALAMVDRDHPITWQQIGVPLEEILQNILKPLNLTYVVRTDRLEITSIDQEAKERFSRAYLFGDSVSSFENFHQSIVGNISIGTWGADGGKNRIAISASPRSFAVSAPQHVHRLLRSSFKPVAK